MLGALFTSKNFTLLKFCDSLSALFNEYQSQFRK